MALLLAWAVTPDLALAASGSGGLGVSLGYSSLSYDQAGVHLDETALTGKLSYGITFGPVNWAVNGFGTIFPLSTSGAATSLRFVGANLRAGRDFQSRSGWLFGISGGYYYTTTFSTNGLGYRNEQGPELFWTFGKTLGARNVFQVSAKQADIWTGIGGISSNYELAFGASFSHATAKGHRWSASVDWADLKATAVNGQLSVLSTTFSLGYTW